MCFLTFLRFNTESQLPSSATRNRSDEVVGALARCSLDFLTLPPRLNVVSARIVAREHRSLSRHKVGQTRTLHLSRVPFCFVSTFCDLNFGFFSFSLFSKIHLWRLDFDIVEEVWRLSRQTRLQLRTTSLSSLSCCPSTNLSTSIWSRSRRCSVSNICTVAASYIATSKRPTCSSPSAAGACACVDDGDRLS